MGQKTQCACGTHAGREGVQPAHKRVVFRVGDAALHARLGAYLEQVKTQTGAAPLHAHVARQAIEEFLDRRAPAAAPKKAGGKKPREDLVRELMEEIRALNPMCSRPSPEALQ